MKPKPLNSLKDKEHQNGYFRFARNSIVFSGHTFKLPKMSFSLILVGLLKLLFDASNGKTNTQNEFSVFTTV